MDAIVRWFGVVMPYPTHPWSWIALEFWALEREFLVGEAMMCVRVTAKHALLERREQQQQQHANFGINNENEKGRERERVREENSWLRMGDRQTLG